MSSLISILLMTGVILFLVITAAFLTAFKQRKNDEKPRQHESE